MWFEKCTGVDMLHRSAGLLGDGVWFRLITRRGGWKVNGGEGEAMRLKEGSNEVVKDWSGDWGFQSEVTERGEGEECCNSEALWVG